MPNSPAAIVTGGAQGLGAAIVIELLKKEYRICIADVQESTLNEFAEEQKNIYGKENIITATCDVTKESDYTRIFDLTLKTFSKIDLLVNNAGIIREQEPHKVLDVNLMGPINGCKTALKYMGKSNGGTGGMVINTASIAGFLPIASIPVYVASKHGVIGLTRSFGRPYHLEKDAVIFTAICPSFIRTKLLNSIDDTLVSGLDFSQRTELMSPEYVAKAVLKLLEDKINGSTLLVTSDRYQYIGVQQELEDISLE
ncbi:15-hydroxyprostaglandin dehydrogenase [Caerostris darwini]|uniref:15-hydroxyprostaglandin dehydrogenase [NAD(+)] n=1 Tax=Caerostris darwini TaxID=1538125 RepID=A0AAV4TMI4_9ARAC|nr:15-hydroxyprostaglandin dehydrogenase [Caerostris darwini]